MRLQHLIDLDRDGYVVTGTFTRLDVRYYRIERRGRVQFQCHCGYRSHRTGVHSHISKKCGKAQYEAGKITDYQI